MKKLTKEEELLRAIFGLSKLPQKEVRRRNQMDKLLKQEFGLNPEEIATLCRNKDRVRLLVQQLEEESELRIKERIKSIEAKALQKMRESSYPNRSRHLRALLAPR